MPFVNVKLVRGATAAQKAEIARGITDTLVRVLAKNPASTHIVFDDVEAENWAVAGQLTSEKRTLAGR